MKPHQIISLMTFAGTDNTLAHGRPRRPHPRRLPAALRRQPKTARSRSTRSLKPEQWIKLIDRLDEIDNPTVAQHAVEVRGRGRQARQPGPQGRVATPPLRFGFVQWEFPGGSGPDPGRYVVRRFAGDDAQQVAGHRRARRAAPARAAAAGARARPSRTPAPVEVTRATVIDAGAAGGERERRGLARAAAGDDADASTGEALAVLNRALARAPDRDRGPAGWRRRRRARAGHARRLRHRRAGRRRATGRRRASCPRRRRGSTREAALRPQERFAALLAGARRGARVRAAGAARARATSTTAARARPRSSSTAALDAALRGARGLARARRDAGAAGRAGGAGRRASRRPPRRRGRAGSTSRRGAVVERALGRLEAALRARTAGARF